MLRPAPQAERKEDPVTGEPFWSLHTHSKFSVNDALPGVPDIVRRGAELGYPAIGLTDHGSPSGNIQLYKAARKAGIEPLPGMEIYLTPDAEQRLQSNMHLTVAAYNETGYRNLCRLATLGARHFYYKPRVDFADLAALADDGLTKGLVVATGCFSGPLVQALVHHGPAAAAKVATTLAGWFPTIYVELMSHGIESFGEGDLDITDDEVLQGCWDVATSTGLPVILTRDSHYLAPEDREAHDTLKRLIGWGDDPDDATFSGEGYWMTDADGIRDAYPRHIFEAGMASLDELANKAYVRLPEMETFTVKVPDVSLTGDPQHELEELVMSLMTPALRKKKAYVDQIRLELDVIRGGDMAAYFLLVYQVAQFMKAKGIQFITRGSACGCLVLWVLGVTPRGLDPIKFGLRFDRFLSGNRMKPPDVDFDVEHRRRDEVIAFTRSLGAVVGVGSLGTYSLNEDETGGDHAKGSLKVKLFTAMRKKGVKNPEWRTVPQHDKELLLRLSAMKLFSGYGRHAAGYIVAPSQASLEQLPLAYIASSQTFVTAYGKKDVEILGFLKLDLLGQKVQTAIRLMEEFTGVEYNAVPQGDARTYAAISKGRTTGIFQLDGFSMTKGCQRLRPRNLDDLIAAQALFRPAARDAGVTGDYLARKAKRMPIPQRHADIMEITKDTYGTLLYQEQVMDVMTRIGMTRDELESMLDAVKASNEYTNGARETIAAMMPRIRELTTDRGWGLADIEWLADGMEAYAGYSFNRAHAASYGQAAYYTAWMRTNRPLEFWTAMLIAHDEDSDHITKYLVEARRDGLRIMPPHVNHSDVTFSFDRERNAIRKGLIAVKGVGPTGAAELKAKAPYASLTDMAERCSGKVSGLKPFHLKGLDPVDAGGMLAALEAAHALEGLSR